VPRESPGPVPMPSLPVIVWAALERVGGSGRIVTSVAPTSTNTRKPACRAGSRSTATGIRSWLDGAVKSRLRSGFSLGVPGGWRLRCRLRPLKPPELRGRVTGLSPAVRSSRDASRRAWAGAPLPARGSAAHLANEGPLGRRAGTRFRRARPPVARSARERAGSMRANCRAARRVAHSAWRGAQPRVSLDGR
jgi:hypothetical protein